MSTSYRSLAKERVKLLRARLDKAISRGQVELHVDLDDVTLLLILAKIVLDIEKESQS